MTPEQRIEILERRLDQFDKADRYLFNKRLDLTFSGFLSGVWPGWIAASGAATYLPPNWSCRYVSTGVYEITHNIGSTNYIILATGYKNGGTGVRDTHVTSLAATTFVVETVVAGTNTNSDFFFLVIRT